MYLLVMFVFLEDHKTFAQWQIPRVSSLELFTPLCYLSFPLVTSEEDTSLRKAHLHSHFVIYIYSSYPSPPPPPSTLLSPSVLVVLLCSFPPYPRYILNIAASSTRIYPLTSSPPYFPPLGPQIHC